MVKDPNYYEGYIAGYWDGVKDSMSGKASCWQSEGIGRLPIQAMTISTRAKNCLKYSGYTYVEDFVRLQNCDIMRMRNLGPKTASEIARWLVEHGILNSAWTEFLSEEEILSI